MTVKELIQHLEELDPDLEVCIEVDGGATRTGDYLDAGCPRIIEVYPVPYGGYEDTLYGHPNENDKANSRKIVIIR